MTENIKMYLKERWLKFWTLSIVPVSVKCVY